MASNIWQALPRRRSGCRRGAPTGAAAPGQGRRHSSPQCLLMVYRRIRRHLPHPPPWPGHPTPECLILVYQCTRTHSPHPPPWPSQSSQYGLLIVQRCARPCPATPMSATTAVWAHPMRRAVTAASSATARSAVPSACGHAHHAHHVLRGVPGNFDLRTCVWIPIKSGSLRLPMSFA